MTIKDGIKLGIGIMIVNFVSNVVLALIGLTGLSLLGSLLN